MRSDLTAERLTVADSIEAVTSLFLEKGWGDGLPTVPPTEEAVLNMLSGTKRDPAEIVASIPPRWGKATIERIAINAVMAGCRPQYMPVLIAAVSAMGEEKVNLRAVQPTTHPAAPLVIVNGPIAAKLDINSKSGAFGPGWRANATIGRAIRLILMNVGGAFPGKTDMSTHGQSCKYSFCIAENEAENPWEPLHVERGFDRGISTVTVTAVENPWNINDHCATTAEELLTTIASVMTNMGNNNVLMQDGEPLVALGPEHAATIARGGLSKRDIKAFLFERTGIPRRNFYARVRDKFFPKSPEDAIMRVAPKIDDITVIVVGGPGKHSMFLPTFGHTHSVTRVVEEA